MTTSTSQAASELIRAGQCTARCLQANKKTACRCNCAGDHHGRLASIEVDGYSTTTEHLA